MHTRVHTRRKRAASISSQQNSRVHVYASCARVCAWIFTKKNFVVLYYLINISFKFHKDWSFRCRDICKIVPTFKNHQFSIFLHILSITCLKSLQRWIITKKLWNFWETRYQNGNLLGEFSI